MKRWLRLSMVLFLAFVSSVEVAMSRSSLDQRRKPPRRTVVVVHKGFPLKRALRNVFVHPPRFKVRIVPSVFLPIIFWATAEDPEPLPERTRLIWEDGETLFQDEDWTEFTLACDNTGTKLWLEVVSGKVQFDWAEVVFGNGEAQVVDMNEWTRGPGYYLLLDFKNGRQVDHVRVVARADVPKARAALKLEK